DVDGFHHLARLVGQRTLRLGGCGGGHDVFSLELMIFLDVRRLRPARDRAKALQWRARPGRSSRKGIASPGRFAIERPAWPDCRSLISRFRRAPDRSNVRVSLINRALLALAPAARLTVALRDGSRHFVSVFNDWCRLAAARCDIDATWRA